MAICEPCADAADLALFNSAPAIHNPAIYRDAAIQPHGCGCQHGHPNPRAKPKAVVPTIRINSAILNGQP